jgi:hypothetical protein
MIGGGIRTGLGANTGVGAGVVDRDTGAADARDAGLEPAARAGVVLLGTLEASSLISSGSSAITAWASSDPTRGEASKWIDGVLDVTMVAGLDVVV